MQNIYGRQDWPVLTTVSLATANNHPYFHQQESKVPYKCAAPPLFCLKLYYARYLLMGIVEGTRMGLVYPSQRARVACRYSLVGAMNAHSFQCLSKRFFSSFTYGVQTSSGRDDVNVMFFCAIFPSVVQIFPLIGAFLCEFSTGLVHLAKTGDIFYSLPQRVMQTKIIAVSTAISCLS